MINTSSQLRRGSVPTAGTGEEINNPSQNPWQYKWKRPELVQVQPCLDGTKNNNSGNVIRPFPSSTEVEVLESSLKGSLPLQCTSARLTLSEVRTLFSRLDRKVNGHKNINNDDDDSVSISSPQESSLSFSRTPTSGKKKTNNKSNANAARRRLEPSMRWEELETSSEEEYDGAFDDDQKNIIGLHPSSNKVLSNGGKEENSSEHDEDVVLTVTILASPSSLSLIDDSRYKHAAKGRGNQKKGSGMSMTMNRERTSVDTFLIPADIVLLQVTSCDIGKDAKADVEDDDDNSYVTPSHPHQKGKTINQRNSDAAVDDRAGGKNNHGDAKYDRLLTSKVLHWPTSALVDTFGITEFNRSDEDSKMDATLDSIDEENENNPLFKAWDAIRTVLNVPKDTSKMTPKERERFFRLEREKHIRSIARNRVGLTSISLSRRKGTMKLSNRDRFGDRAAIRDDDDMDDAMDVLQAMTFGIMTGDDYINDDEAASTSESYKENMPNNDYGVQGDDDQGNIAEDSNSSHGDSSSSDLILSCLTNDGKVHMFSILDLLCPRKKDGTVKTQVETGEESSSSDEEDFIGSGFASLLLGDALHSKIKDTMLPLSKPIATVSLSLVTGIFIDKSKREYLNDVNETEKSRNTGVDKTRDNIVSTKGSVSTSLDGFTKTSHEEGNDSGLGDNINSDNSENNSNEETLMQGNESAFAENLSIQNEKPKQHQTPSATLKEFEQPFNDDQMARPFIDLSLFDANIESTSAKYQTIRNIPTTCVAAFEYVAIGGKGERKVLRKFLKKSGIEKSTILNPEKKKEVKDSDQKWNTSGDQGGKSFPVRDKTKYSGKGNEEGLSSSTSHDTLKNSPLDAFNSKGTIPSNTFKKNHDDSPEPKDNLSHIQYSNGKPKLPGTEKEVDKWEWREFYTEGGFVTLISLKHFSEARTIFLSFIPKIISPIVWESMQFLLILGYDVDQSIAIRIDNFHNISSGTREPSLGTQENRTNTSQSPVPTSAFATPLEHETLHRPVSPTQRKKIFIKKFAPLSVSISNLDGQNNEFGVKPYPIAVTSMLTSPPSIVLCYSTTSGHFLHLQSLDRLEKLQPKRSGLISQSGAALSGSGLTFITCHKPGSSACIPVAPDFSDPLSVQGNAVQQPGGVWCIGGQGWSLVGVESIMTCEIFFVSWEGATAIQGAYATHIQSVEKCLALQGVIGSNAITCCVLPTEDKVTIRDNAFKRSTNKAEENVRIKLPFTSDYSIPSVLKKDDLMDHPSITNYAECGTRYRSTSTSFSLQRDFNRDNIVINAMESIRSLSYTEDINLSPIRSMQFRRNHVEIPLKQKSQVLLRQCNSWTRLDDTKENRALFEEQITVGKICAGPILQNHYSLTMRKNVVTNGVATPFEECLSWLCQQKDFYTAASVALNLLRDFEAVHDLWGFPGMEEDEDNRSYIDGLLDGIVPIDSNEFLIAEKQLKNTKFISGYMVDTTNDGMRTEVQHNTITSLADMAVGCMIKGGAGMSHALDGFLYRNRYYDASRACLMLVASAATTISELNSDDMTHLAPYSYFPLTSETHALWPIQCLLRIAVTRDCMKTALLLLNVTIPNEMRHRMPRIDEYSASPCRPSIDLCKSIVSMILASSQSASGLLLSLVDDDTQEIFWDSLQHDTRLALSLLPIRGKYPLLREAEVRLWALEYLGNAIKASIGLLRNNDAQEFAPTEWLLEICAGCLSNAGCDLSIISSHQNAVSTINEETTVNNDGMSQLLEDEDLIHKALTTKTGMGGIDFDLLIPALLLLQHRSVNWRESVFVSTQSMLNAVCNLAGRLMSEEAHFAFDGVTVMKQCAAIENVMAAANLIGGHDGFVLKCANVLINFADLNMKEAEICLLRGKQGESKHSIQNEDISFELTVGHRDLLWLLEKHVLCVKKYGEFDVIHYSRGKIDPIFAARVCFRAWLCLMEKGYPSSGIWLSQWLSKRLQLNNNDGAESKKRLACAVLARALLWSEDPARSEMVTEKETGSFTLAELMGIDVQFLVTLSQTCCGLVESIPPSIAEEIMNESESNNQLRLPSISL